MERVGLYIYIRFERSFFGTHEWEKSSHSTLYQRARVVAIFERQMI